MDGKKSTHVCCNGEIQLSYCVSRKAHSEVGENYERDKILSSWTECAVVQVDYYQWATVMKSNMKKTNHDDKCSYSIHVIYDNHIHFQTKKLHIWAQEWE